MDDAFGQMTTLLGVVQHNLAWVMDLTRQDTTREAYRAAVKARTALSEAQSICARQAYEQALGKPLPW
jgi:hypothetical protein